MCEAVAVGRVGAEQGCCAGAPRGLFWTRLAREPAAIAEDFDYVGRGESVLERSGRGRRFLIRFRVKHQWFGSYTPARSRDLGRSCSSRASTVSRSPTAVNAGSIVPATRRAFRKIARSPARRLRTSMLLSSACRANRSFRPQPAIELVEHDVNGDKGPPCGVPSSTGLTSPPSITPTGRNAASTRWASNS